MALEILGAPYLHIGSCDVMPSVATLIKSNFSPASFYADIRSRNNDLVAGPIDLYTAGFPCPPYSSNGRRLGTSDPVSGEIVRYVIRFIAEKLPRTFILENVKGMVTGRMRVLEQLLEFITLHGHYTVTWRVVDAAECGLPQSRPRVWIIGVLKEVDAGSFAWPPPFDPPDLDCVLDLDDADCVVTAANHPPMSQVVNFFRL